MIPLKLTVKNFMCYRDNVPTLDLEGVHVACLCGDNGHGKTALLDAITWALWGQARARTQEELVHQGQSDMAVELEFMARGQRYRVNRKHARSARARQGATVLELQVASENGFLPITGNTVRETEARIRETLHMDYDTFINTAYVRQGDADRFTTSPPGKRKEHLAEVLDLSYYQGLEERAKVMSRSFQEDIQRLESAIDLGRQEIANRPEQEAQLASFTATLDKITPEAEAQGAKVDELQRTVDSLQARSVELAEMDRRLERERTDLPQLKTQVQAHEARVGDYESAMGREDEIRQRFADLEASRAELERLNHALARKSELDQEKSRLEREVAIQRERLSGQVTQLETRIAQELEPKANRRTEIEQGLLATAQEVDKLGKLEDTIRQRRQATQEISTKSRDFKLANDRLHQEMEETRKKFDMLERGEDVCPVCRQPLGLEGQEHLRREYEVLGLERKGQYRDNATEQKSLDQRHKEITMDLARLEAELDQQREHTQRKAAGLERDLDDSKKAQGERQQALGELGVVQTRLRTEDYAQDERRTMSQVETELSTLGYDDQKHKRVREQIKALEAYSELHRKLQEAVEGLPAERGALDTARHMLDRRQAETLEDEARKAALKQELVTMPSLGEQLKDAQRRYGQLKGQREEALVEKGVLEKQLESGAALERDLVQQEKQRRSSLDEKSVYDELSAAFGKNGIQALIIETAIPQLEADSNELLGRLTENRMFLKLQLLEGRRDSRTGLPSEELDIKIADEVGTRSYETFSGGEAFRINFALRIALSKLLARRSGAPLPILFIDEGFGSQDSAGQERLTESIRSIQDDFQKIIVITHIEQIKEAFPVRIEVTKSGPGSTFEMM